MTLLSDLQDLLTNNWNSANTNNRTPIITNRFEIKRIDFNLQGSKDYVLLRELTRVIEDNGSGANSKQITTIAVIDIRTTHSYNQMVLLREEVERILNNAQIDPFGNQEYEISDITDGKDLSDGLVKLFRYEINVKFQQLNVAV